MNRISITLGVVTQLCTLAAYAAPQNQKDSKPNFVLFMADDCSYYDIGCYGGTNIKTPRIDQFAKEGMLFTKGYEAAPMSSPTRNNLFTGLWPVKTGAYPNHTFCSNDTESIVHQLRPMGYKVALIGKHHIGTPNVFPFDLYVAPVSKGGDVDYGAINKFIDDCKANGNPYCLLVTSNQPHTPWTVGDVDAIDNDKLELPPFFVDTQTTRKEYAKYLAEVNYMDGEFGKVLDILDEKKEADKSVVVFLSEQGNSLAFSKWTCYDVGVHSAYIVRWPEMVKPASVSDAIVEYVDIVPTFVDIAGGDLVAPVDGKSIKKVLLGKKKSHKKYTYSLQTTRGINDGPTYYGIRAVADERYRYILNLTPEVKFVNAFTTTDLFVEWEQMAKTDTFAKKIVDSYNYRTPEELYDVENDPYCMNNLINDPKLAKKKAELADALKAWMDECGDSGQQTEMDAYYHTSKGAQKRLDRLDKLEAAK